MSASSGPFDGLRIIEFGQFVAAPYCGELFAHGGAEVISVEPVAGSPTRHNQRVGDDGVQYVNKARGKRSMALDLRSEAGRRVARDLCLSADVVISNLRPGVLRELGLDWETIRHDHPALIVAEVDGFGDTGPKAGQACVDLVAQAASGLALSTSPHPDQLPPADVLPCDYMAGSLLAFAVASALVVRAQTGEGQRVATSLVATGLALQTRTASVVESTDAWKHELVERRQAGEPMTELADWRRERMGGSAAFFYSVYETNDGWVAIAAVARHAPTLLGILGLDASDLTSPGRWGDLSVAATHRLVADLVRERPVDDLVAALTERGIPALRLSFLEDAMLDDDNVAAGFVQVFDHPRLGPMRLPSAPVRFSTSAYGPATDTPALGADSQVLLAELGYADADVADLIGAGTVGTPESAAPPRAPAATLPAGATGPTGPTTSKGDHDD